MREAISKALANPAYVARITMLGAIFIWGSSFIVTKSTVEEVPPFILAFLRFMVASAFFFLIKRKQVSYRNIPVLPLIISGFFGITAFYALINYGLIYTTVASASAIQGTIPAISLLLGAIFLHEKINLRKVVAVVLSISGIVLIVSTAGSLVVSNEQMLGNILVLASTFAGACYMVYCKQLLGSIDYITFTAWMLLFGTLMLLPTAAMELINLNGILAISFFDVIKIFYLGVVSSALAYILWHYALASINSAEAGVYLNLIPVIAFAAGVLILKEAVVAQNYIGCLLVVTGAYIANGKKVRTG